MSKTTENVLLVPGESGWEIWTGQAGAPLKLLVATAVEVAGDLPELPAGDLLLLFPVKAITALPMRVSSDDDALFPDLAALHAERLGLRPDPMAGQLTDLFIIAREPENTALVSVLLRAPAEGDMPSRGPKGFDLSARAYPLPGDSLAIWKELGRWVFSLSLQGNLVYCQATSVTAASPDENLTREIRLAVMQLGMQNLEIKPAQVVLWSDFENIDTRVLAAAFHVPIEVSARPAPILPHPLSKLLPADIRAARRAARKRQNLVLGIAAVALLYLGVLGWFGYGLWRDNKETEKLSALAAAAAPEGEAYSLHIQKWDELANAIELEKSPVQILSVIASCIPPSSGLRLKTADISADEIKLVGEAPQLEAANTLSLNLGKKIDLERFRWETPPSSQSPRGWEFTFTAEPPKVEGQP